MTMIKTQFLLLSAFLKTSLDEVYPNVFVALWIMLNCPVTVACAERSFSKLKLMKTFNRSHMTDSRYRVPTHFYKSFSILFQY